MTNDKAVKLLHRIADEQFDGIHGDERREALEMAVRALFSQQIVNDSQGLVNDCISRNMAIDAVVRAMIDGADAELVEGVMELLPSAQPERKKGKWTSDGHCPFCGEHAPFWCLASTYYKSNFCPSCGADMRGESND